MLSLNHLGYGAEVDITPGRLEHFYLIQIPLEGTARITNGTRTFEVGRGVGSILNPTLPTRMVWKNGCRKFLVQINGGELSRLVDALLGLSSPVPIVFEPRVDIARPEMNAWLGQLSRCVKAAEANRAFGSSGYRFQRVIEEELVLGLVQAQPSSITHFLESPCARPAGAAHVRRARAFLHDNAAQGFAVADLVRVAGCGLRSLQMGFQAAFGITPQQYARRARLDLAHARLQLAASGDTVAGIAHETGFAHLGRFSQTYRQVFGQSPSVTLQTGKSVHFDCYGLR